MNRSFFVVGLVTLNLISACATDFSDDSEEAVATAPEKIFTASVVPLPMPNNYAVKLRWPEEMRSSDYFVERSGGKEGNVLLETAELPDSKPVLLGLKSGVSYQFNLKHRSGAAIELIEETSIKIPSDVEVDNVAQFVGLQDVGRLFVKDGAILITRGEELRVIADELIVPNASLRTYEENKNAPPGVAGGNAGAIRIEVKKASGSLKIAAYGEQGGAGEDGLQGVSGTPGIAGAAGGWAFTENLVLGGRSEISGYHLWKSRMTESSLPPAGDPLWSEGSRGKQWAYCAQAPTDGGPGGHGTSGSDGKPGLPGGNAPIVSITVLEQSPLTVEITQGAGLGGAGGRPGKGGTGGSGGLAGDLDPGHLCPPAKPGVAGISGLDGRAGDNGKSGGQGKYCFKNGTAIVGTCPSE